jgi:CBS domain-containing protein
VARLKGEALTAASELKIAVVGPATSLTLAAGFAAAGQLTSNAGLELISSVLLWLARINAVLAVFNLVPAFPLDGGRVLRAWLWRKRERAAATSVAARVGRGFARLMIAVGLVQAVFGEQLGGLWLALVGWFLLDAARTEEAQALVTRALEGVLVRDIMSPDPICSPDWITVDAFITDYALRHDHSAFPVIDFEGHPRGLVTVAGVREVQSRDRELRRVRDVAHPMSQVPAARPDDKLTELLARMPDGSHRRALVIQDGRVEGIVSARDIERAVDRASLNEDAPGASPRVVSE